MGSQRDEKFTLQEPSVPLRISDSENISDRDLKPRVTAPLSSPASDSSHMQGNTLDQNFNIEVKAQLSPKDFVPKRIVFSPKSATPVQSTSSASVTDWKWLSGKEGGASGAGEHGGFYEYKGADKSLENRKALIKQDSSGKTVHHHKNMAEVFYSAVSRYIFRDFPNLIAEVNIAETSDHKKNDNNTVYAASLLVPRYGSDLVDDAMGALLVVDEFKEYRERWADWVEKQKGTIPADRPKFIGTRTPGQEVLGRVSGVGALFFHPLSEILATNRYDMTLVLGRVARLFVEDADVHSANSGTIIEDGADIIKVPKKITGKNDTKQIVISKQQVSVCGFDLAWAGHQLDGSLHLENDKKRYKVYKGCPSNHHSEHMALTITPVYAYGLDRLNKLVDDEGNLDPGLIEVMSSTLAIMKDSWNVSAFRTWAKHSGVPDEKLKEFVGAKDDDTDAKNKIAQVFLDHNIACFIERAAFAKKLAFEIRVETLFEEQYFKNRGNGHTTLSTGTKYKDVISETSEYTLDSLIKEDPMYFASRFSGKEKFIFRKNVNSVSSAKEIMISKFKQLVMAVETKWSAEEKLTAEDERILNARNYLIKVSPYLGFQNTISRNIYTNSARNSNSKHRRTSSAESTPYRDNPSTASTVVNTPETPSAGVAHRRRSSSAESDIGRGNLIGEFNESNGHSDDDGMGTGLTTVLEEMPEDQPKPLLQHPKDPTTGQEDNYGAYAVAMGIGFTILGGGAYLAPMVIAAAAIPPFGIFIAACTLTIGLVFLLATAMYKLNKWLDEPASPSKDTQKDVPANNDKNEKRSKNSKSSVRSNNYSKGSIGTSKNSNASRASTNDGNSQNDGGYESDSDPKEDDLLTSEAPFLPAAGVGRTQDFNSSTGSAIQSQAVRFVLLPPQQQSTAQISNRLGIAPDATGKFCLDVGDEVDMNPIDPRAEEEPEVFLTPRASNVLAEALNFDASSSNNVSGNHPEEQQLLKSDRTSSYPRL